MKEMDENTQELKKIEKEYNAYIDKKWNYLNLFFALKIKWINLMLILHQKKKN
jgi:hypothetical protein